MVSKPFPVPLGYDDSLRLEFVGRHLHVQVMGDLFRLGAISYTRVP